MNVFLNENAKLHKNNILLLMINFEDNKTAHLTLTHNNHYSEDSLKNPKQFMTEKVHTRFVLQLFVEVVKRDEQIFLI